MSEKKSVAFICQPYHRGGVTRWMADAAIAYALDGHEVYFMTLEPIIPFFSGRGRETMLDLLSKSNTNIHIVKAKVGHAFEFGTSDYCVFIYKQLFLKLPLGTPVILSDDSMIWQAATSLHSSFPIIGVLHADEEYYYNLGDRYADKIDALVCVSKRVNIKIAKRISATGFNMIYTIPCGVDLPPINTNYVKSNILQLVYVGRITNYQKRVGDLAKIAAALLHQGIGFHLNIIGDGDADKKELEKNIRNSGLENNVTLRGWLSKKEVMQFLYDSDLLVLTSDFEGTPIAMMEALACGCGIAGTRVSGIEDYENAPGAPSCYMVNEVGDIEVAVNNIMKLAVVPAKIRKLSARAIAEENFSMMVCLGKYQHVLDNIRSRQYISSLTKLSISKIAYSHMISYFRYIKMKFIK